MPDSKSLPSLNALRAFAVAGRCLSLTTAAEELFVTPSALSHQIRGLEEALGVKLFERTYKGLELTKAGQSILPGIRDGFEQISQALALLQERPEEDVLTVSMLSTFAMRWFIPRLARFQQIHPDIDVRISTSVALVDFKREGIDCAIRSGAGTWPDVIAQRLFAEQFAPVCSPALATPDTPLAKPEDLQHHTLLHAELRPDDWRIWLHSAGAGNLRPKHEQVFETRNFAIQAAVDGLGVAIIDPSLVTEEIHSGRLIQPFAQILASESAYYLVYPERVAQSRRITAFRDWLLSEVAEITE
ncbi:MAG: transcriptional regulator GcvA [Mariprofundaceae bacterium]